MSTAAHPDPEIRTADGTVRGRREGAVAVFRGIPYARPPVGPLRFSAPVPVQPWDRVRDALAFGPPAPSRSAPDDGSGDWLTLNVWSPDLGAAGLPVMVWIHGGAYQADSSRSPRYDGATLAAGGAVVVSLNYRLGVDGFAHLDGAPDNRGLLDQVAALRWVQDNIGAFGGDPGTVTVFGQSAGAGSVAALLAMPRAEGLFRRAIAQSVPGTFFTTALAADVAATIAAELGRKAGVDDLAAVAPDELVGATEAVVRTLPQRSGSWGPVAQTPTPFSPVVDGDVLPRSPWPVLARGDGCDVDVLVGHTRDEYRMIAERMADELTDERVARTLDALAPVPDGSAVYRSAYPDAGPALLYELVNADWLMRMPSLHVAEAQHAGGGRAWSYELTWGFGPAGAAHGLDTGLVFGTLDRTAAPAEAADLARQMRADWVRFATTGDPGWPAYTPDARATRVYSAEPSTLPYPEEASRRIWQEHRFDTLDLLT